MVMYTSGTTGRPKGVLHTHNTLHALMRQIGQHWLVEPGDRFPRRLARSAISAARSMRSKRRCCWAARAVLMDQWDAAAAGALMLAERITHMAGATPFLAAAAGGGAGGSYTPA